MLRYVTRSSRVFRHAKLPYIGEDYKILVNVKNDTKEMINYEGARMT